MPYNAWFLSPVGGAAPRMRLFCLSCAGGGASLYRAWPGNLPADIATYLVQLPGRESRLLEPPFAHMVPLIEALGQALQPYLNDMPFAFFGHSMGALLSFELARYLRRSARPWPAALIVSGCRAPQLPDRSPPLRQFPNRELLDQLREIGVTPEAVLENAELMELILPALRADITLFETYRYQPDRALFCAIIAYDGTHDPRVSREEILGWQQTFGRFDYQLLPGDHFFLQTAQQALLQSLAAQLRWCRL